jgi:hypothetical protein
MKTQGNWVVEIGWRMPSIDVAGKIACGDQGSLRAAGPSMIMIIMMMMEIVF